MEYTARSFAFMLFRGGVTMHRIPIIFLLLAFAFPALLFGEQAADPCAPPVFKIYKEKNMFNAQQEIWLGEVLDEQAVKGYDRIEDPDGYLQKLGERLVAQLPPTDRNYRFYIIDYPVVNAFSLGGSNIYIPRQMIAFLKNEDELAGLLGHEIGHVATHQIAIDITLLLRKALDIKEVGDRQDIFEKWNQFQDIEQKKHGGRRDEAWEEDEQRIADRIGLFVMMRAGYAPAQAARFFDRLAETQGKKGNFFTDLFGITSDESKRLRLLINKATPLPAPCVSAPTNTAEKFAAWQKAVISAKRLRREEKVEGILGKTELNPPLRGSIDYVQFSPDGKYLLVQDESSVFVLSREPLATLFQFDALHGQAIQSTPGLRNENYDAMADQSVQFTPDSRSVVFYDMELRVEKWDIETQSRTSVNEIALPRPCLRTSLSSTGEVLACLRLDRHAESYAADYYLLLIDVATGTTFFSKKIPSPDLADIYDFASQPLRLFPLLSFLNFNLGFSPDGHYFVLGSNKMAVAYDLQAHKEISVNHNVHRYTSSRFVFSRPETIIGLDSEHKDQAAVMNFPSGDIVESFPLKANNQPLVNIYGSEGKLMPAARGPYLLVSPAARWPMAVFDLERKQFLFGYKTPAVAIYGQTIAAEELGGRITLFGLFDKKPMGSVQLPISPLPPLAASEISPDGKWLALAGRTSGGVWNVSDGKLALDTATFTGAFFDQNQLFATFYKLEQQPKVERLDIGDRKEEVLYTVDLPDPRKKDGSVHHFVWQSGNLLIEEENKKLIELLGCIDCKLHIKAMDIRTNKMVWEHAFRNYVPKFFYSSAAGTLSLLYESQYSVKTEAKNDPALKPWFDRMPDKESLNLVEVLDPQSGKVLGAVFVDTGKTSVIPVTAINAGDTVLVYDTENRTHVFSLKSGQQRGKVVGKFLDISANGERMLVENGKGNCDLYDTSTLKSLAHFSFPSRPVEVEFVSDGTLLILVADQILYRLQVPGNAANASLH